MTEGYRSATPYFDGYKTIIASRIVTGDRIAWFRSKQVEKRKLF